MYRILLITVILALGLINYSCNSCSKQEKKSNETMLDFESINVIDSIDAVFYALPSPEEIITYINDNKVSFSHKLLHNYNYSKLYNGQEKKTLICGVYFADLAYISAFKKSDYSADYIATIEYMLSDLDITPDFTMDQKRRIVNASSEVDSLYSISRELYDTIISYLQEYDDGKTLSLLSIGTLIESLYITTYLHPDFDTQKEAINRIAEQQLLFDDIITMTLTYKEDPIVNVLLNDLMTLKKSFDNLNMTNEVGEVSTDNQGTMHIESKSSFDITEENYVIFSDNLRDFRTKLVNTKL